MEHDGNLKMGISHTTRPLRGDERDGHDYYFVSRQEFLAMRERGEFLESAEVFGHLYGTSRPMIEALACDGSDVVLEIDTQGASQLRAKGFADLGISPVSAGSVLPDYLWKFRPSGQYDEMTNSARNLRKNGA